MSASMIQTSSVHWLSDLSDVEGATAKLTRTRSGAAYSFRTTGLLDAMEAEIHLVLRTHGPAIPGMIDEMRSTFEAACTPESSAGFGSGSNECADLQAAAFTAP